MSTYPFRLGTVWIREVCRGRHLVVRFHMIQPLFKNPGGQLLICWPESPCAPNGHAPGSNRDGCRFEHDIMLPLGISGGPGRFANPETGPVRFRLTIPVPLVIRLSNLIILFPSCICFPFRAPDMLSARRMLGPCFKYRIKDRKTRLRKRLRFGRRRGEIFLMLRRVFRMSG